MQPIIENNKASIIELCKKHGVRELFVFGSAVRNDYSSNSDIDFLVSYYESIDALAAFDSFLEMKNSLQEMLQREVDLIDSASIDNKYLRHFINQEKRIIYGQA